MASSSIRGPHRMLTMLAPLWQAGHRYMKVERYTTHPGEMMQAKAF